MRVPTTRWYARLEADLAQLLTVGSLVELTLRFDSREFAGAVPITIPVSALEIVLYVDAPGFLLANDHARSVAVVDGQVLQTSLSFQLYALSSGQLPIRLVLYPGGDVSGVTPVGLQLTVEIAAPIDAADVRELLDRRSIPQPTPDVVLYVATEQEPSRRTVQYYMSCPELGLDREALPAAGLTVTDLQHLRQTAIAAAAPSRDAPPKELERGLQAIGAMLFDRLMPPATTCVARTGISRG